jgi:hypothetical protein
MHGLDQDSFDAVNGRKHISSLVDRTGREADYAM